jgi:hypothetical protein
MSACVRGGVGLEQDLKCWMQPRKPPMHLRLGVPRAGQNCLAHWQKPEQDSGGRLDRETGEILGVVDETTFWGANAVLIHHSTVSTVRMWYIFGLYYRSHLIHHIRAGGMPGAGSSPSSLSMCMRLSVQSSITSGWVPGKIFLVLSMG